MSNRAAKDQGQAFPIYVVMVAGLLFLAFAFFAVGQASASRNGVQGAADAAALAAAQEAREDLALAWTENVLVPTNWQIIFNGLLGQNVFRECAAAESFAGRNKASLHGNCRPEWTPYLAYKVNATAQQPIGKSVVPGTETKFATATATAAVKPLCIILPNPDPTASLPILKCKHARIFDPYHNPADLPTAKDLFDVYLVD
ncbi:pilus assembly protein TadG-related protein [Streptomyces sp. NPDC054841]